MRLLGIAMLALAAVSYAEPAQAVEYDAPILLFTPERLSNLVVGDINGDGLLDIVTTHSSVDWVKAYDDRVAISLQRPSGNFDMPLVHACECRIGDLKLLRDSRHAADKILFSSDTDGWTDPTLHRPGFAVLELSPDNTIISVRYREPFMEGALPAIVDINQDGAQDLFFSYYSDDNTTPGNEFAYAIWYGDGARGTIGGRGETRGGFTRYQGPRFLYTGYTDPRDRRAIRASSEVDIDGDGYVDLIEGRCPTECMYRQEPFGRLKMVPTTIDAGYDMTGALTFADVNGDGLADRMYSSERNLHVLMQQPARHFAWIATLENLFFAETPVVSDLDNDGLNDILITSEDPMVGGLGWLDMLMQEPDGRLRLESLKLLGYTGARPLIVEDINGDGCRDILIRGRYLSYIRTKGCRPPFDRSVALATQGNTVSARVVHERGAAAPDGRTLRVVVSPTKDDENDSGFMVNPPGGCHGVGAEPPRRIFNCTLPASHEGDVMAFEFSFAFAPSTPAIELDAVAFVLGASDDKPGNNRVRLKAVFNVAPPAPRSLH